MNRLRIVRAEKKMTQFKLSVLTGIIQSRLSYIENGLVEPCEDEKKKIAEALGVNVTDIWGAGGGMEPDPIRIWLNLVYQRWQL